MTGNIPENPKIYHIIHVDRLESILHDGFLYSDEYMHKKSDKGTMIGIPAIKERRLTKNNNKQCVFTNANAGTFYFEDYSDFSQLYKIDWDAVNAIDWRGKKEGKQAEFLIEDRICWDLVERIGVHNLPIYQKVSTILSKVNVSQPTLEIKTGWYY
jgi:hypothetical protein